MSLESLIRRTITTFVGGAAAVGILTSTFNAPGAEMAITKQGVWPEIPRGIPEDVVMVGNYAYALYIGTGLKVLDVSDPANISVLGYCETGVGSKLAISASKVFVASMSGLQIIDVSDPTKPKIVGALAGYAWDVAVRDNLAYIADMNDGLVIAEISDPSNPRELSKYRLEIGTFGVAVSGDLAYVTSDTQLYILNVSDPTNPRLQGKCGGLSGGSRPALSGQYAYVADWSSSRQLEIFDISSPTNPTLVGSFGTHGTGVAVEVKDQRAYLASGSGLEIVDITAPAAPHLLGSYPVKATGITCHGSQVYLTTFARGLLALDASDPSHPALIGSYDRPGGAQSVAVSETLAVVADHSALQLIDTTEPARPVQISSISTQALDVAISSKHAFVAAGTAGLLVVDISEPGHPRILSRVPAVGAYSIRISGDRAFLADTSSGLRIFDISNPETPTQVGAFTNISQIAALELLGDYVVAINLQKPPEDSDSGISVIDVSNPSSPELVWHYKGLYHRLAVLGSHAYAAEMSGTRVLDLSNPKLPTWIANYDSAVLSTIGDYLLLSRGDVSDVSDPRHPRKVGYVPEHLGQTALSGNRLLSASGDHGLIIYTIEPFLNSIALQPSKLTIKWDAFGSAKLQRSAGLPASSWQDVPSSETTNRIDLPIGGTSEFFRVIRSN